MPPVLAYHLVMTAYGFWLPNDPRGSWSDVVRSFALYCAAGPATKVRTRRSVAGAAHDHAARQRGKDALVRPPVHFTPPQIQAIAEGFKDYCIKNHRRVLALAILTDHVHMVIARCNLDIETVAEQLKARATIFLSKAGLHPFANDPYHGGRLPTPWARRAWPVFLHSVDDILRAIRYVQANPEKAGDPPQDYDWLTPFDPRDFQR